MVARIGFMHTPVEEVDQVYCIPRTQFGFDSRFPYCQWPTQWTKATAEDRGREFHHDVAINNSAAKTRRGKPAEPARANNSIHPL